MDFVNKIAPGFFLNQFWLALGRFIRGRSVCHYYLPGGTIFASIKLVKQLSLGTKRTDKYSSINFFLYRKGTPFSPPLRGISFV
jgi:hypothetical protein